MSKKFLTPVAPPQLDLDPSSGVAGAIYFNTSINALKVYNGTTWELVSGNNNGVSASSVQVLSSPPSSPLEGTLYFDTTEGTIKVYNGYTWYDAGGPKELINHNHYADEGLVNEAFFGEYVAEEQIFLDGGTSTTTYSHDIIDGGDSNG